MTKQRTTCFDNFYYFKAHIQYVHAVTHILQQTTIPYTFNNI